MGLIWILESSDPHVQGFIPVLSVELACVEGTRNENAYIYTRGKYLLPFLLSLPIQKKKKRSGSLSFLFFN